MNKTIATLIGLTLAIPAAPAMARNDKHDNHGNRGHASVHVNHGQQVRQVARANPFRKGQRFVASRAPYYQVVDYHRYRRLGPPPRGYHWVRSGNDALLVAIGGGLISSVVTGLF